MSTKLFIDDVRTAPSSDYATVRSTDEAKAYVMQNGCPDYISFDHDLGGADTAMQFVKWLVDYDMDSNGSVIPANFQFNVHSANPVGAQNIAGYLNSYLGQRDIPVQEKTEEM